MTVRRYRSIEDMPRPWRAPDDPENLHEAALMLGLHRAFNHAVKWKTGVHRYRSIEEAEADRDDRVGR